MPNFALFTIYETALSKGVKLSKEINFLFSPVLTKSYPIERDQS